ncbi:MULTISPECIES: acyl carrier protein [Lentzea]|uniref:Acyl carrier protein n=1 Tax=Lentzea jiangxiensis TaxID=641025 RepID=A0A1H0S6T0_9PSEU|nr:MULTISPECIES: phosphopantetheine-binding protein [Lentzea]MCG8928073.1 phosphopantetheine-binding protein [Lentzea sp. CC55]SDP37424.1 acyl carrier protein [Lentzea jiangxiensis]
MSNNDTLNRLTTLLVSHFGASEQRVSGTATFEELDFDSLALVELAMVAQKEFGVEVDEQEITPDQSVQDVAELIDARTVAA